MSFLSKGQVFLFRTSAHDAIFFLFHLMLKFNFACYVEQAANCNFHGQSILNWLNVFLKMKL